MGRHHVFRVRLVDPIGHGASGTVWRAWDVRLHRYVAAKVVPDDQEVVLRAPVHPHVLTPFATVHQDSTHYALMHLVRGGTADGLLAEHGALPAPYVAVLLRQLLQALGAVHAAGFAHRDVKPANLLLEPTRTGRPHVYLSDLGVAARLSRRPATAVGTPGYVAPELRPGDPPDPRHDLYAAGVTAAELLTGRIPRHVREVPSNPLRALLMALLDPDPERRPATADLAERRLRSVGVPEGAPWRAERCPPDVRDRLPRPTVLRRLRGPR
ncbi:MAG TPA: serine/threonine-protein kinase [Nocardioides sp.]|uniref:serine/threonine-protein kinase n=1 Tax=Nocardioides sp. TaxID=35761 RepID=UPI002F429EA3